MNLPNKIQIFDYLRFVGRRNLVLIFYGNMLVSVETTSFPTIEIPDHFVIKTIRKSNFEALEFLVSRITSKIDEPE